MDIFSSPVIDSFWQHYDKIIAMKYITILLFLLSFSYASGHYFSNAPVPSTELLNVDADSCDEACQQRLLDERKFFSLGARAAETNPEALYYKNLFSHNLYKDENKIAILLPSKVIGRYSIFVTNAVTAYLLSTKKPFTLKTLWATLAMHVSKRNGQGQVVEFGSHPKTNRNYEESAAAKS